MRGRPRLVPALPLDPAEALAGALASRVPSGSIAGMEALACAILNRAEAEDGPDAVARLSSEAMTRLPDDARVLDAAGRIARRALARLLADPTGGATAWHEEPDHPDWARSLIPCHSAGGFLFYAMPARQNASSPQIRTGSGKSR